MGYACGIQHRLIGLNDLSAEFRGGLAEQLTGQELHSTRNNQRKTPLFWVREKRQSQAEVDFLERVGAQMVPVEIKSGGAGKLRSLNRFMELYSGGTVAVRLYRNGFLVQEAGVNPHRFRLLNIPYYHVAKIGEYIETEAKSGETKRGNVED